MLKSIFSLILFVSVVAQSATVDDSVYIKESEGLTVEQIAEKAIKASGDVKSIFNMEDMSFSIQKRSDGTYQISDSHCAGVAEVSMDTYYPVVDSSADAYTVATAKINTELVYCE